MTRRARILVAEDDVEMRKVLASTLRREGYEVVEATNGTEALAHLGPERTSWPGRPDLVVADVRMPGCTGLELLAGLRLVDWAMPAILITAFGDHDTYREALRLGALTVFNKPFDVDSLRAVVRDVVPPRLD